MKKQLLVSLMALAASAASAQIAEVSTPRRLLAGVESDMYYPVLSRDGSQVMFTSVDYTGLRMYDFNDNVTKRLSDRPRAGLSASFESADRPVKIATEGARLIVTDNGVERFYTPVESHAGYLWESLSPDGRKIMFVAAGKGIVVTDLNGKVLSMPGNYEAPVWYGNDLIVAMDATDDGHQYRSSRIVMLRADGSEMQPLTRPESMSMFPTASIESGKVVYNTIDGLLYEIDVKLK